MTPPKAMGSSKMLPHSKRSPPAAWKESLRHACLDRARQRWSNQQQQHNQQQMGHTAEQIISWEMQQSGVSLSRDNRQDRDDDNGQERYGHDYCVTEDEWLDLIEQVEAELASIRFQQEIDEQDMYLEHQIASYEDSQQQEQWTASNGHSMTLCPLCWIGALTTTDTNHIVCSDSMDGSCNMRLSYSFQESPIQTLEEILQKTIESHAMSCPGTVSFQMDPQGAVLMAHCLVCKGSHQIRL